MYCSFKKDTETFNYRSIKNGKNRNMLKLSKFAYSNGNQITTRFGAKFVECMLRFLGLKKKVTKE